MRAAIARHLAAHAHEAEAILDRAFQRPGQFGDGHRGEIGEIVVGHGAI
jgi:hypothetical protein